MLILHVYRVKHQRSSIRPRCNHVGLRPLPEIAQPVPQIAPLRDLKPLTPDP